MTKAAKVRAVAVWLGLVSERRERRIPSWRVLLAVGAFGVVSFVLIFTTPDIDLSVWLPIAILFVGLLTLLVVMKARDRTRR